MKHILLNEEIKDLLKCSNSFEWNKMFIKRVSQAVHFDSINLMDKNKEKLKEEYYAFVNRIYYDEVGERIAIGSDYYSEYQTFYNFFVQGEEGKEKVIQECLEAVTSLDELGIDFWDIHPFNILVNKEKHIKLVDLDGSKVRKHDDKDRLYAFIDMIIESYFFFDMKSSTSSSMIDFGRNLHNLVSLEKYYSTAAVLLIQGTYLKANVLKDIELLLKELEDQDKISDIRNKVKSVRPFWFN